MRFVELCFHERDALSADLAVRGLTEAGLCAIRRPVDDARAPAVSQAAGRRILLHSPAFAALPPNHPVFADADLGTVVVPLGPHWPLRRSRTWLIAPPGDRLGAVGFWKAVAQAVNRPVPDRDARLAAQQDLFRALKVADGKVPVRRRRQALGDMMDIRPMAAVRSSRDWEAAVTPMAVVATLVLAAGASALAVDVATRPEAWGAISQSPTPDEASTNAFAGTAPPY